MSSSTESTTTDSSIVRFSMQNRSKDKIEAIPKQWRAKDWDSGYWVEIPQEDIIHYPAMMRYNYLWNGNPKKEEESIKRSAKKTVWLPVDLVEEKRNQQW